MLLRMIRRHLAMVVIVLIATTATAGAQTSDPVSRGESTAPQPSTHAIDPPMPSWSSLFGDIPHDLRHMPDRTNLIWLGGAGVAALSVHAMDAAITRAAFTADDLDLPFEAGSTLGSGWLEVGGALGAFAGAKLAGRPAVAMVASDLFRAQMIGSVTTQAVKFAVGRRRPDGGAHSFPSGHTSAVFASATVLQRHFGWRIGAPAYASAIYVATSRLQENHHYPSDVIFGAAIGIVAGRSVTVARHALVMSPLVTPRGIGIEWTAR